MNEEYDENEVILNERVQALREYPEHKNKSIGELKRLAQTEMQIEESQGKRSRALYE